MHLGEEFSGRMRFWVQANLVCCQLWQAYLQNDSKQTHAELRVGKRQSSNNIAFAMGRVMPPTRSCLGFHVSDTKKRILNNRARGKGMTISQRYKQEGRDFEPPVSFYAGRKFLQWKAEQFPGNIRQEGRTVSRAALWGSLPSMKFITPIPSSPPTIILFPKEPNNHGNVLELG